MSVNSATHLVLAKKAYANRINFAIAHPDITARTRHFESNRFETLTSGTWVEVIFRMTKTGRRHLLTSRVLENEGLDPLEFKIQWATKNESRLLRQAELAAEYMGARGKSTEVKDQHVKHYTSRMKSTLTVEETPDAEEKPESSLPVLTAKWVGDVFVSEASVKVFEAAHAISQTGEQVNVMMVGPSGYGKTSIPEAFAKEKEMKFYRMNCAQVRDPEQWFGYAEAIDGSTHFVETEFTKIVQGGNAIVVLDEFNRVESWMHNVLFPLLDHARKTTVHNHDIVCGENVIFVATINAGYQYTGTFVLDQAISNRFDAFVKVGPLPQPIESSLLRKRHDITALQAEQIVSAMTKIRQLNEEGQIEVDASTRTSLKIARMVASKVISMMDAFEMVLVSSLELDDRKNVIDAVNTIF